MKNELQPPFQLGTTQKVLTDGVSAAITNATDANTRVIRIASNVATHFTLGTSPTATTNHPLLGANQEIYVLTPGATKVAVIEAVTGENGVVTVTECSK